jgi:hypothetical protein
MVRKARMTVIVSGVVAAVTCGSTLNAALDATREARAALVREILGTLIVLIAIGLVLSIEIRL